MYKKQFSAALFHDHNPFSLFPSPSSPSPSSPFPSSPAQIYPIHTLENHKVEIWVLEGEAPDTVEVEILVLVVEGQDTAEEDNSPCTVLSSNLLVLLEGVDLAHDRLVVVQFE